MSTPFVRAASRRSCRRTGSRSAARRRSRFLIRCRTASAECASPSPEDAIEAVKKYFSSNMPRGVLMYLFVVARDTVDSWISTASAISRKISGLRYWTPFGEKQLLPLNDGRGHLHDRRGALVQRFDQPVRRLQLLVEVFLVFLAQLAVPSPGPEYVLLTRTRGAGFPGSAQQSNHPAGLARSSTSGVTTWAPSFE